MKSFLGGALTSLVNPQMMAKGAVNAYADPAHPESVAALDRA
jgi:hypothetical protein